MNKIRVNFFIATTLLLSPFVCTANDQAFQMQGDTIQSVETAIKQHQLTCVQLTQRYLNRIKKYNLALNRGAPINAFTNINPSVMNEAQKLDAYFNKTGNLKGPLHCIPVIIKDNIDTYDSTSTSGSLSLLGSQPTQDAFLVKQLRQAGAIIIGKGAMDEFASGMSGISSRSGRVGNALNPNLNSGGSSAGPAAAVSANFAIIGIGTDNSGSIRIPAVFNGIYGLRPSTGLISQTGIFPRGNLDGVAGPLARNVTDLAITLSVIAKNSDPHDPKTQQIPRVNSYSNLLDAKYLRGKRIGVIQSVADIKPFSSKNKNSEKIFYSALDQFQKLGTTLVNIDLPKFNNDRSKNMAGEIEEINRYLAAFPSTRKNFKDICLSNRTQTFGGVKGCLQHLQETPKENSQTYQSVLKLFLENRKYVTEIMQKNNLDALIMPTSGSASYDISEVNTWRAPVSSNSGLPAITIIAGYSKVKMPVGMELIGKMYDEQQLIAMAYAFSKNTQTNIQPNLGKISNEKPMNLSIPKYNNLITKIGYESYKKVLQNGDPKNLTAERFTQIAKKCHFAT